MLETADLVASVAGFVIAAVGLSTALRRRKSPTEAERLDRLAEVVAAQWRDEAEVRGITPAWTSVELPANRRLVVVGPPGAGKTVAAVRIVRGLLARRKRGGPVAVLFAPHSWDPDQDLPDWMAGELARDYGMSRSVASGLVRARRIVPVLDGLDEAAYPAAALAALHRSHDPGAPDPLILTSRDHVTLPDATVVVLGPPRVPGWTGISSPLLLWLAKSSGTDPAELAGLPEEEVERRLLDRFVPTAYPDTPLPNGRRPRWRAEQAQDWLRFLSRQEDIAWWQLIRVVPRTVIALLSALIIGPVVWVGMWLCLLLLSGTGSILDELPVIAAVAQALLAVLMGFVRPYPDVSRLRPGTRLHVLGTLGGFAAGFLLGLIAGPISAVVTGVVSGVLWGTVGRIEADTPPTAASPAGALRGDLVVTVVGSLPVPAMFATGLSFELPLWKAPLIFAVFWLFYGVSWIGITAWSRFVVARLWLAARGRTPLRLMAFLDDAHRCGILRRVGPGYQFRHARLRERLAAPDPPEAA